MKILRLKLDEQMKAHLKEIVAEAKTESEWNEVAADDWFQSENYCGGFDSPEDGFTFSFYDEHNQEYWFQFPLSVVEIALAAPEYFFEARPADV